MGPITFDVIEVGDDRTTALRRAQAVRDCGVRVDLTKKASGEFRLMVRSEGGEKARAAIEQQITTDTEKVNGDDPTP